MTADLHEEDYYEDDDCWQCGGEGRVNDCVDGCCVDTDDIYCAWCSHPCDICSPVKPNPELQEVLQEAIEKSAEPGPNAVGGGLRTSQPDSGETA